MEGLIPFVIHAIKKSRERSRYMSLSDESSHGRSRGPWPDKEGSSRHRRTRSEFQQRPQGSDYLHGSGGHNAPPPSDLQRRRGLAPSRSLKDGTRPSAASSGARGATGALWCSVIDGWGRKHILRVPTTPTMT